MGRKTGNGRGMLKKMLLFVGCVAAVVGLAAYFFLQSYMQSWVSREASRRGIVYTCSDMGFSGWNRFSIRGLSLYPSASDTLLFVDTLKLKLDLFQGLRLRPSLEEVTGSNIRLHLVKKNGLSNWDVLFHRKANRVRKEEQDLSQRDYASNVNRLLNGMFRLLPQQASLQRVAVVCEMDSDEWQVQLPRLSTDEGKFQTTLISHEKGRTSEWRCEGQIDPSSHELSLLLSPQSSADVALPYLTYRWGADVMFDTLQVQMQPMSASADPLRLQGKVEVSGLRLYHAAVSPDTVGLDRGAVEGCVNIGPDYFEIDSATSIHFNRLDFHPYLRIERDTSWKVTASVRKMDFPAQDLFASLPGGLFPNLQGLQVSGSLSYQFALHADGGNLDSLTFNSELKRGKDFRIEAFGETDLAKMNEPFEYTAYENGEPVKCFEVGPSYACFRPLYTISRYLPLAIMQSEDAGFFQHRGFIMSAIQESLIQDLKAHRFVRGGSTLSMQLVKNVFLSRKKTIARKLEEMLIVWLIEENGLTSKERMFEVYLNIAEWGPGIYGAAEASHFYFAKEPSELTLAESIYMAGIIPRPKHFKYSFDGRNLKESNDAFFDLLLRRMLERGRITADEAAGVSPRQVHITGPALRYLEDTGEESAP